MELFRARRASPLPYAQVVVIARGPSVLNVSPQCQQMQGRGGPPCEAVPMTSVTRPRARSALVSGVAVLLLAGAVGCDSGDNIGDSSEAAAPGSHGSDLPAGVDSVITIEHGEGMDA